MTTEETYPWVIGGKDYDPEKLSWEAARKFHKHLAHCSKCCCGNPRRHFGNITRQEVRADDSARDQGIYLPHKKGRDY